MSMRVQLHELRVGDQLTAEVFNKYGLHVMANGTILSEEDIRKLSRHQIEHVHITAREIVSVEVERNTQAEVIISQIQPKFENAVIGIRHLFEQTEDYGKIDLSIVNRSFTPLVQQFRNEKDIVSLLLTLTSTDDYTFQHSVQVGMISYYIAKWIGMDENGALLAGKAGYLHDIGKSQVDKKLINKPGKLTPEEFDKMKMHTVYGHEIISRSITSQLELALVALQHHERLNGSGYPNGLTAEQIHPLSRIVAVADVYSAMISSRIYQKKKDFLYVLRELHKLSFSELDPRIVHTFIQKMIPNFIGKKLILKNGESGIILMTNPTDPFRPLIRLNQEFLDLSKNHQLEVDTIYM